MSKKQPPNVMRSSRSRINCFRTFTVRYGNLSKTMRRLATYCLLLFLVSLCNGCAASPQIINTKQRVPEHLLRHQEIPKNLVDPVTMEDLILQIGVLEGLVEKCNIDKDAIRRAMGQ